MMIAHLFNKVYLSFDVFFQPAFDTLTVSTDHYAPHLSFVNQHIGTGQHHGNHTQASDVDWKSFFDSVNDRRTVIHADAKNFATIYFCFLKTINADISKQSAVKLLEIVLKRTEFIVSHWTHKRITDHTAKKDKTLEIVAQIRSTVDETWAASTAFELSQDFVHQGMSIEFLIAQFWADGRNQSLLKQKLETMWWKTFVSWGEEYFKIYVIDYLFHHPDSSKESLMAELSQSQDLFWMADVSLTEDTAAEFRAKHDWSVIEKIYTQITSTQNNSLVIQLNKQWQNIVDKNWTVILDKNDPLSLLAVFTEPTFRSLVNGWLISYFAAQPVDKLKEMVL